MTALLVSALAVLSSPGGVMNVSDALETIARTGVLPGGEDPAEFLATAWESGAERLAVAWAAWSSGNPLPVGPAVELLEFGAGEPSASDVEQAGNGALEALLMRLFHSVAAGEQPALPELVDSILQRDAATLPLSTLRLALQAYGRLGVSSGLWPSELKSDTAGRPSSQWLRYLSETRSEPEPFDPSGMTSLARIYASRTLPLQSLHGLMSDTLWAVRYEVAARVPPESLAPLLDDEADCVALRAASRMREAGLGGFREALRRLSTVPGPVGSSAIALLGREDSDLLAPLLSDEDGARRLSALQAWLDAGLEVPPEMEERILADPYWLVPVVYLETTAGMGDSARARDLARSRLASADDRNLREALAAFLGVELPEGHARPDLPEGILAADVPEALTIRLDIGDLDVRLWPGTAPVTCAAFAWLAASDFYDGIRFHRVIPGFVAQAGCPQGNGYGGPGFLLPNERSTARFTRGVIGMADAGLDTGGSQFFIMLDDHDRLDCRYTAFGEVTGGTADLDEIRIGTRILDIVPSATEP